METSFNLDSPWKHLSKSSLLKILEKWRDNFLKIIIIIFLPRHVGS